MKLLVLLFCSLIISVSCFKFEDPQQEGVNFGSSSGVTQSISVDENNDSTLRVKFVLVTDVDCDKLIINPTNDNSKLLQIQTADPTDRQCYLEANRLDYESIGTNKIFSIDVYEGDPSNLQSIILEILNLDDESPTLTSTTCTMEEEKEITVDISTCTLTVSDQDGFLSTMDFSNIDSSVKDIFEIVFKDQPADNVYEADAYVVTKSGVKLDYETTKLYNFRLSATDGGNHASIPSSVPIIVEVKDVNDQKPQWVTFQSAYTVKEETETKIQFKAKDGDYGIDSEISYTVEGSGITIDETTGEVTIPKIDRDTDPATDQVTFSVTAIKKDDTTFTLTGNVTLIIEDIDDNVPALSVIGSDEKIIDVEVEENTAAIEVEILAYDCDLGENAIYTTSLTTNLTIEIDKAFAIIPSRGYEKTSLTLAINDPSLLNYEKKDWRIITMNLVTTGTKNPDNTDTLPITITLIDINDESPTFEKDNYEIEVYENVDIGTSIINIQATDDDQEDMDNGLKHQLIGTLANNILKIEDLGGDVTTKKANAFDYETTQEVIVQIRASDNGNNTGTTQLTITVLDVNDEDPKLILESPLSVQENTPAGTIINPNNETYATDDDQKTNLEFEINWNRSYAMKNSQRIKTEIFEKFQCIQVEKLPGESVNKAYAQLTIIEAEGSSLLDYETFDTVYLYLDVTDTNTESGTGTNSGVIVLTIGDENDNEPKFRDGTETEKRQVSENSNSDTVITSVTATDDDIGTQLHYFIEPVDDTPNWVAINEETGTITVSLEDGAVIDCDNPLRYNLTYLVTASDGDFNTTATINIDILDINDVKPEMEDASVSIAEEAEGENRQDEIVLELKPTDGDRDEPNNVVSCSFGKSTSDSVSRRFTIDNNVIKVNLVDGATLDREEFPTGFTFELSCIDDPQQQGGLPSNSISPPPKINISLTDINDNAPTLVTPEITGVNENTALGALDTTVQGQDKDEGDNGLITFVKVSKIERYISGNDNDPEPDTPQDLISIANGENDNEGVLSIDKSLKDYWGDLVLTIELEDKGTPKLTGQGQVKVVVAKYNFNEPKFIYPDQNEMVEFLQTSQDKNAALKLYTGDPMSNIKIDDGQNAKFSFSFTITEQTNDGLFKLTTVTKTEAQLQLTSDTFSQERNKIVIRASIDESAEPKEQPTTKEITLYIDFFDEDTTNPIFPGEDSDRIDSVTFDENTKGLTYQVKNASYAKTDLPDGLKIFYLLRDGDKTIFGLDHTSGLLTLLKELDYESETQYNLTIQSSNQDNKIDQQAPTETQFHLTVLVGNLNDVAPVFDPKDYVGTLTVTDKVGTNLVQLKATDIDSPSDKLVYQIKSINGSDSAMMDKFKITSGGIVQSDYTPKSTDSGFFILEVTVHDEDDTPEHTDTANVRIYLVTDSNIVTFRFGNTPEVVINCTDAIKTVLGESFKNYETTVETPTAEDDWTNTPIYFLSSTTNTPIPSSDIYKQVTDPTVFNKLKSDFATYNLVLMSFSIESDTDEDMEATLKAWLIGVSVVLGALCMILLVAFILKTRALQQRINKLSNTKFGSQESGLNRSGVTAPTTNKHAVEGSNPVYNIEEDTTNIDRASVTSGGSELIGVEDDDKFNYIESKGNFDSYIKDEDNFDSHIKDEDNFDPQIKNEDNFY